MAIHKMSLQMLTMTKTMKIKWEKGRQHTGYEVIKLCSLVWPISFDVWLLRFREGDYIPPHVDIVENGDHYRFNIILKNAGMGGEFLCSSPIYESKRIKYFRSDISEHSVTKVEKGVRYVLSIGWARMLH